MFLYFKGVGVQLSTVLQCAGKIIKIVLFYATSTQQAHIVIMFSAAFPSAEFV